MHSHMAYYSLHQPRQYNINNYTDKSTSYQFFYHQNQAQGLNNNLIKMVCLKQMLSEATNKF